jgi:pimeloyl-ACP methyl ester carboxylesterase
MNDRKTLFTVILLLAVPAVLWAGDEASKVESADGTEIVYEVHGEGSPALVFIHCWSCDRGYWREQVGVFSESHKLVAIDLAGHGDSEAGREDYTMAAFARDVVAVLETEKITEAILIGHSMGGPVAVEAALLAPDRVRAIIGVDNFKKFKEEITPEQIEAFAGSMQQNFSYMVNHWVMGMFPANADSTLKAEIAGDMAAGDPVVGVSALRNVLEWLGGGGVERIAGLKVNLTTISSDMQETMVEANREIVPGFEVRIMKRVGHFPMRENPAEFNQLLAEAVGD